MNLSWSEHQYTTRNSTWTQPLVALLNTSLTIAGFVAHIAIIAWCMVLEGPSHHPSIMHAAAPAGPQSPDIRLKYVLGYPGAQGVHAQRERVRYLPLLPQVDAPPLLWRLVACLALDAMDCRRQHLCVRRYGPTLVCVMY